VLTDSAYRSRDLAIFLTKVHDETSFSSFVTYFVADIYVQDITLLKTAPAGQDFNSPMAGSVKKMAQTNGALFAASGDYYAHSNRALIIRNGASYNDRPSTRFESCVLYRDGTMAFYAPEELDVQALLDAGAWQGWTFGPSLLSEEGQPLESIPKMYVGVDKKNPRCMLGYYEPGHYCLVVADGRGDSAGMTLPQLSALFSELGCAAAYNLDGGNSSLMVWHGETVNHPSGGGRASSDAILITEVQDLCAR
jgi:exopolysaccharide biosynthesis protein